MSFIMDQTRSPECFGSIVLTLFAPSRTPGNDASDLPRIDNLLAQVR